MTAMSEVAEYLDILDYQPGELVGLFWKRGDDQETAVLPFAAVEYAISQIDRSYDIYLAPNPTKGPPRTSKQGKGFGGRGKEADVTRVLAVYADLDIKPGACPDFESAIDITKEVSGIIGIEPVATIFSGGGIQPIWKLDDCDPAIGKRLLARFGRLVKTVAAARDITVDSVFDTARVLRVPGSLNHKYNPAREAALIVGRGAPIDPDTLSERLDEVGIADIDDDDELGADVVARPSDSPWATETCAYMLSVIEEWKREQVTDRHPWLLCQLVRLECARRYACLTETDYRRAHNVLEIRFRNEGARPGDERTIPRLEISDLRAEADSRASRKTDAQLSIELGGDTGHTHSLDALVANMTFDQTVLAQAVLSGGEVGVSAAAVLPSGGEPPERPEIIAGIVETEQNFWDSRDSLKSIYEYALSRTASPWSVLGCCAATALAWVRPTATLEALVGAGPGSLNWFCCLAAGSGGGKSTSWATARRIMPDNARTRTIGVGSGEGLLEAFARRGKDANGAAQMSVRESLLVNIDEVDSLAAQKSRSGSTLIPLLKSAFTGGELSFSYVSKKYPVLRDQTYRLTLIANVQPGKAGWIFEDVKGGFPQRFMWFPARDHRITRARYRKEDFTLGLVLPDASEYEYPRTLFVPPQAVDAVMDARIRANSVEFEDGLESHMLFTQLKFAYALAVLDGRAEMTSEDWRLAGIAQNVSNLTRDWVLTGIRAEREREDTERGERLGTARAVSDATALAYSTDRAERIMGRVAVRISEAGQQGAPDRALKKSFESKDRHYVTAALTKLAAEGVIVSKTTGERGGVAWFLR
jgi:hypothetical protein